MLEGADVVYKKVSGNCTDFAKGHKKAASKLKRLFFVDDEGFFISQT